MYAIRSACESLGISPHRLRKWESRYDLAAAARGRSGRREYDPLTLARLAKMVECVRSGQAPAQAAAEIFGARISKRPWSKKLAVAADRVARIFDFQKVKILFRQYESTFGAVSAFDVVWMPLIERLAAGNDPMSQAAFRFVIYTLTQLLSAASASPYNKILVIPWPTSAPWKARLWSLVLMRAGYSACCVEGLSPETLARLEGRWKPQAIIVVADSFPPAYVRAEQLNKFQKFNSRTPMLFVGVRKNRPNRRNQSVQFLDGHFESTVRAVQRFVPRGTKR